MEIYGKQSYSHPNFINIFNLYINSLCDHVFLGSAADFTDCFPNSPRQPMRKKVSKPEVMSEIPEGDVGTECNEGRSNISQENDKFKAPAQSTPEKQHRNPRPHIDRAKPRKSPNRPLPGTAYVITAFVKHK